MLLLPFWLAAGCVFGAPGVDFNRDIRPILAENCFACHGPDKNKRKAGLRLDRNQDATATLESIVAKLAARYNGPVVEISRQVGGFLDRLRAKNLLELA